VLRFGLDFAAERTWMTEGTEAIVLVGGPRDTKKWSEILRDPNVQFPGESTEYRPAREQLLESECSSFDALTAPLKSQPKHLTENRNG
jgi:hypothetical protein